MAGRFSTRKLFVFLATLFAIPVQATPASTLEKRQYDNTEIKIDESKHDEQFYNFVTRPDIDAPRWKLKVYNESALSAGYWFTTAYGIVKQTSANRKAYVGPYIYDQKGELVWSGAASVDFYSIFDFKVSKLHGKPVISFLHPNYGAAYILNSHYETEKELVLLDRDGNMLDKDTVNIHDLQIWEDSYGIMTRYAQDLDRKTMRTTMNYNGACTVEFQGFRESNLDTNELQFEWNSDAYIPLTESYTGAEGGCEDDSVWDYFHANSIDKFPNGDYLLSARHSYALYRISAVNGSVLWKFDGTGERESDFQWIGDGHFLGQHDARMLASNGTHTLISIMDNALGPGIPRSNNPQSRGLVISLREDEMTAAVVASFDHPEGRYALGRGNMQLLPNDNAFVGWSVDAAHSEFTPDGECLMHARMPAGLKTYRSYKFEWVGQPKSPPDVMSNAIIFKGTIITTVYVSWNGATEVATWNLYKTNADGDVTELIATRKKEGFETSLTHKGLASYVMVEGVDKNGKRLGISNVIKTAAPADLNSLSPAVVAENQWQTDHSQGVLVESSRGLFDNFSNPVVAFISGMFFCAAALYSARALKNMRRKGGSVQSWWLPNQYERLASYNSDAGDEESQEEHKMSRLGEMKEIPPKYEEDYDDDSR